MRWVSLSSSNEISNPLVLSELRDEEEPFLVVPFKKGVPMDTLPFAAFLKEIESHSK